jgi:dolichyl-phosphate beta-glucosyltransferase
MSEIVIVVPCYNEEERLDFQELVQLLEVEGLTLLFVDDGSTDGTNDKISHYAQASQGRVELLTQRENSGKAEAVRAGLNHAVTKGAKIVGYLDADMATPASEMVRLIETLRVSGVQVVLGSRIRLLGGRVERSAARHYLGRVFATVASAALRLEVYDTQCGAKVFRVNRALLLALEQPFKSRWAFDVELIERLLTARSGALRSADFVEVPLRVWNDRAGSKLSVIGMLKSGLDLIEIAWRRAR